MERRRKIWHFAKKVGWKERERERKIESRLFRLIKRIVDIRFPFRTWPNLLLFQILIDCIQWEKYRRRFKRGRE